jgi:hypothetical protein
MKKNKKATTLFSEPVKRSETGNFRMRLAAGKYAINATEAEVHLDGARIAGGDGSFEFDIAREAWVEIHIVRS